MSVPEETRKRRIQAIKNMDNDDLSKFLRNQAKEAQWVKKEIRYLSPDRSDHEEWRRNRIVERLRNMADELEAVEFGPEEDTSQKGESSG